MRRRSLVAKRFKNVPACHLLSDGVKAPLFAVFFNRPCSSKSRATSACLDVFDPPRQFLEYHAIYFAFGRGRVRAAQAAVLFVRYKHVDYCDPAVFSRA